MATNQKEQDTGCLLWIVIIIGVSAFFGIRGCVRNRITAPFKSHLAKYSSLPVRDYKGNPKKIEFKDRVCGKLIVIDRKNKQVDPVFFSLNEKTRASLPQEVGTVVWVKWGEQKTGTYSDGAAAYVPNATVTVIDPMTPAIVAETKFQGGSPPSVKKRGGSRSGERPTKKVLQYLETLPHLRLASLSGGSNSFDNAITDFQRGNLDPDEDGETKLNEREGEVDEDHSASSKPRAPPQETPVRWEAVQLTQASQKVSFAARPKSNQSIEASLTNQAKSPLIVTVLSGTRLRSKDSRGNIVITETKKIRLPAEGTVKSTFSVVPILADIFTYTEYDVAWPIRPKDRDVKLCSDRQFESESFRIRQLSLALALWDNVSYVNSQLKHKKLGPPLSNDELKQIKQIFVRTGIAKDYKWVNTALTENANQIDLKVGIRSRKISAEVVGNGIRSVSLKIQSQDQQPYKVTIPVGLVFRSSSSSAQNMIAIKAIECIIKPNASQRIVVPASCINMNKDIPRGNDTFSISTVASGDLALLVKSTGFQKAGTTLQQNAVWTITDNPSRSGYKVVTSSLVPIVVGGGPSDQHFREIEMLFKEAGIDASKYRALRSAAPKKPNRVTRDKGQPVHKEWPLRKWTDKGGRVIKAKMIRSQFGIITLEKKDGTLLTVNADRLSTKDRRWVEREFKSE